MKQSSLDLLTVFLSETISTSLLVFLGCMGCVDGLGHTPTHLSICLGFGFAVMLCVNIFGCISGAHMNPAVTLCAVVYKLVSIPTAIVYVIGQLLGAYLGYGLLRVVTPHHFFTDDSFCVTLPSPIITQTQAFTVEFIITMVLILVCCAVWDHRQSKFHDSLPLRFGMTITVLALAGGPYTGGSMNPARSFGPALYNGNFTNHWIYWIAPLSSSLITSVAYKMIFWREAPREVLAAEELPLQLKSVKNNGIECDP